MMKNEYVYLSGYNGTFYLFNESTKKIIDLGDYLEINLLSDPEFSFFNKKKIAFFEVEIICSSEQSTFITWFLTFSRLEVVRLITFLTTTKQAILVPAQFEHKNHTYYKLRINGKVPGVLV